MRDIFTGIAWIAIITLIYYFIVDSFFQVSIVTINKNGDLLSISEFFRLNKILIIPFIFYIISIIPGFILIIKEIKKRLIKR